MTFSLFATLRAGIDSGLLLPPFRARSLPPLLCVTDATRWMLRALCRVRLGRESTQIVQVLSIFKRNSSYEDVLADDGAPSIGAAKREREKESWLQYA